ncbi:hypothetical protein MLD38_007039 [Melastoma candidum]|nr:hypothetical protein MLD38_007039 [Melastoma candidum]
MRGAVSMALAYNQFTRSNKKSRDNTLDVTKQCLICTIITAFGGLMISYDIGISEEATSMDDFLIKFFPEVYVRKHRAKENNYWKYNNPELQLFTSSLYLAAILASLCASMLCKKFGRRPVIRAASLFFLIGACFNFFAGDRA